MPREFASSLKKLIFPLTDKKTFLIIASFGILLFFNSLFNEFVFDDIPQVVENPFIHSIKNIPSFFTGGTFYSGSENLIGVYYKPLLSTFFSVIYNFFGESYFAFHFFQILLHIVNACLLYLLLKHFFKNYLPLFLSLIFLAHPINSEVVFYISGAQEVLFFFFGLLSLLLLIKRAKSGFYFGLAMLCLLLSVLSKETGFLFFVVDFIYLFVWGRKVFFKFIAFSLPVLASYFFFRINAVGLFSKANAPIGYADLATRLINIPSLMFFYLKTFTLPLQLSSSYQWIIEEASTKNFFLPLLVDMAFLFFMAFFAISIYRKGLTDYFRSYMFFGIWFVAGVLLHLQLFPLDATVSERWFYFPIVGLLGMIGVLLEVYGFDFKQKRVLVFVLLLLGLLSVRTFRRSFDWRNSFRLAMQDIKIVKENYAFENVIAFTLLRRGELEEARKHAERSVAINPFSANYNTLGLIYLHLSDYPKAKEAYLRALEYGASYYVYENLAGLAQIYGDPEENVEFIKNSVEKFPNNARLRLYLAVLEYSRGNKEEARRTISEARSLDWQDEEIQNIYYIITNNKQINLEFRTK